MQALKNCPVKMMSWSAERRFMVTGVIQHQKGILVIELPVHGSGRIKVQLAAACPEPRTDRYRFYQEYETTPPSLEGGVKFLMGETKRYHTTMENYACACRAAEDEEYDSPEDVWDQLLFRRKEEI